MKLPTPLIEGKLINRYKRFLADIKLDNGKLITAHCPNSGSMKACDYPGSPVLFSKSDNPKRKLKYTWELVLIKGTWVGINTMHPNRLVKEAIEQELIAGLTGYTTIRPEVSYAANSRIDLLLEKNHEKCYVEVKNVTLVESRRALFPDAVTTRGQKHLRDLMLMVDQGHRGVIFFVIHRADADQFAPADDIDAEYGKLLRQAAKHGVELLAYQTRITPPEVVISHPLPIILP